MYYREAELWWLRIIKMLDFHNHLVPMVDDGAASLEESLKGVAALADAGVTSVITTPHFRGSICKREAAFVVEMERIDRNYTDFAAAALKAFPLMKVARGVEIALDVPELDLTDPRLRLGGTKFALVEFPFFGVPPNSDLALRRISAAGWNPVLAHPERYESPTDIVEDAIRWKDAGALLQTNHGSLTGDYGDTAAERGWKLLEAGLVDFLSADYHSRGTPSTARSKKLFESKNASDQFELLTDINPVRLSRDLLPVEVAPIEKSFWRRLGRKSKH